MVVAACVNHLERRWPLYLHVSPRLHDSPSSFSWSHQLVSTGYVRVGPLRPKVTSSRPPITVDDLSRYHRCKPVITFHFSSLRLPWHRHALPIQNTASINFFNPSVGSDQTKIDQANQTKCSNYIRIASVQLTKMESTHRHHHKHGNATDDNQNTSS